MIHSVEVQMELVSNLIISSYNFNVFFYFICRYNGSFWLFFLVAPIFPGSAYFSW